MPRERHRIPQFPQLDEHLNRGKGVVIHCRQGIGRSSVIAAALLLNQGTGLDNALARITQARRIPVPETSGQRTWLEHFDAALNHFRRSAILS